MENHSYDFCIVGSGFGGSVSALRLAEKGYKVAVIEKGQRFRSQDFPKTNWNLKKWFWMPWLNWRGFFKMTFLRHLTVYSGVGVGGGSLVYASTLPIPKDHFFRASSWAHLANWKDELHKHYQTARRMLGVSTNPKLTYSDQIMEDVAKTIGKQESFAPSEVGIFMGEGGKTVADPFFGGKGPARTGCTFCGSCLTGCRQGAKNSLDFNYLYLAENLGVRVMSNSQVVHIKPLEAGKQGYEITIHEKSPGLKNRSKKLFAQQVVFSGGVLGTLDLLLKLRERSDGLPMLSNSLGCGIRTNSEAVIGVTVPKKDVNFSDGIAISSILHTDEHSHLEPVRFGSGSGFFRILLAPHAPGDTFLQRLFATLRSVLRHPGKWIRALFLSDFAKHTQILLYMRSLEGTLRFRRGRSLFTLFRKGIISYVEPGDEKPKASIPEATDLAMIFGKKVGGVVTNLFTETILNIPSTAHVLGGCCMGKGPEDGVIDHRHRVFGYDGLYVVDGSAVSANPGVNPSLTITAMAERAMGFIPPKIQSNTNQNRISDDGLNHS
ncbi:MAG: GMC oxidoreductase [Oligoflexales bacterium]